MRMSFRMYLSNFKRNLYLTISVAVSLFLFLVVSLFMDFSYATYEKGSYRVQSNYIAITCNSEEAYNTISYMFRPQEYISFKYGTAGSVLDVPYGKQAIINYNVISAEQLYEGIYIYSGLDGYGGEDSSNAYNYESYKLICGRSEFNSPYEVIITEEYAKLLAPNVSDVLGQQIIIGTDGIGITYTVIGVCEQSLTETRINKAAFSQLNRLTEENAAGVDLEPFVFTVILSSESLKKNAYNCHTIYLFFDNDKSYNKYVQKLLLLEEDNKLTNQFSYITPDEITASNEAEQKNSTLTKSILMIIVAIVSGISIFGTMINSISDRKKEIGIKKALGASDWDIMRCFIYENIINSCVAIFFAIDLAFVFFLCYVFFQRQILMVDYTVAFFSSTIVLFICYSFSSILGFSLIPAYSAAQVNIIDTIRDE